ncbi:MAG: hypothetical protein Q4Q13_00780, partial [Vagococcus sp.]|nr:hypothetical protein [Vagococcus sp.]
LAASAGWDELSVEANLKSLTNKDRKLLSDSKTCSILRRWIMKKRLVLFSEFNTPIDNVDNLCQGHC